MTWDAVRTDNNILLVKTGNLAIRDLICQNTISDAFSAEQVAAWKGRSIEAVAACGNKVICACLEGVLYIVDGQDVSEVKLSRTDLWPVSGTSIDSHTVLFVCQRGKFIFVDVDSRGTWVRSLMELGVPRPGRDLSCALPASEGGVYVFGWREFILHMDALGNECTVCHTSRSDISYCSAAYYRDRIWIAATEGAYSCVVEFEAGKIVGHKSPIGAEPYYPRMVSYRDSLLFIGSREVYRRDSEKWRKIHESRKDTIARVIPWQDRIVVVDNSGVVTECEVR